MLLIFRQIRFRLFVSLFAGAIAIALLIGPVLARSRGDLEKEIRELAAKDVENDIARRHQFAIDQFKDDPVGMKAPEIALIFSAITLFNLLQSWQLTALIQLLSLGICIALWKRAKHLEARSQNPLQGGILEAALRGNRHPK